MPKKPRGPPFPKELPLHLQDVKTEVIVGFDCLDDCQQSYEHFQANKSYEEEDYSNAIRLYNLCLKECRHPILLSNRAASYLKRKWNGDVYAALYDSYEALQLDPTHIKSRLR